MGLWTPEHARTVPPAVAVMVIAAVILRRLLKNKADKIRMLPFRIIAVALVILEIGKQGMSLINGYDLYVLPFHFCSLALFMVPVMAFYKGKHTAAVRNITAVVCASITLLTLIYPNLIYSGWNVINYFHGYGDFHTVTFHNLVIFAFILILALDLHTPQPSGEAKQLIWFTVGFCLVSASMATILETNYANYYQCNIPVFENIRVGLQPVLGVWNAQLLYITIVSVLTVLFVLMTWQLYRLLHRLCCGKVKKSAPV